jgi:hypothetical protein
LTTIKHLLKERRFSRELPEMNHTINVTEPISAPSLSKESVSVVMNVHIGRCYEKKYGLSDEYMITDTFQNFRHELPEDNDLTHQNIRDRYYGTNDPVAKKMLNRVRGGNTALTPPEDKSVVRIMTDHGLFHE